VSGSVGAWIEHFFNHINLRVVVDGFGSSWNTVKSGVPQGSFLGPLLYLLYLNDIPKLITSEVKLFADDMKWHVIR
jgi:ribonucleases P/MRP protein subunit RPP40